jgi:5'-AMP-activated protein kinase catalytic alpha subunit
MFTTSVSHSGDAHTPTFDAASHNHESYTIFFFLICCLLVQLYKTRDEKYLLDLQRVSGPQLLFLDLCAAFLAQLRVL